MRMENEGESTGRLARAQNLKEHQCLRDSVRFRSPRTGRGGTSRDLEKEGNGMNKGAEAQQLWLILETVWTIVFILTVSQVYLFRVMIMSTLPPFLFLKGVKTLQYHKRPRIKKTADIFAHY